MFQLPDTVWARKPWMEEADREAWQMETMSSDYQRRMIANALINADPGTSSARLRKTAQPPPPRYGYDVSTPGISDVLSVVKPADRSFTNDYSNSIGSYSATATPTMQNLV